MHALEPVPIEDSKSVVSVLAKVNYGFPVHVEWNYFLHQILKSFCDMKCFALRIKHRTEHLRFNYSFYLYRLLYDH